MKVVTPGHHYLLDNLDGSNKNVLNFVNRNPRQESQGTYNQEVLRVLIDRVNFLDRQLPWDGNKKIIHNLEMALVLHECRALERKVEKNKIDVTSLPVGSDGHFIFSSSDTAFPWILKDR